MFQFFAGYVVTWVIANTNPSLIIKMLRLLHCAIHKVLLKLLEFRVEGATPEPPPTARGLDIFCPRSATFESLSSKSFRQSELDTIQYPTRHDQDFSNFFHSLRLSR